MFPDPGAALNAFRNDYPGESGARNVIRGDGFFNIDMGLSKRWKMPWNEKQSLHIELLLPWHAACTLNSRDA